MGRDYTAFHLWESKNIFIFLYSFRFSPSGTKAQLPPQSPGTWVPPPALRPLGADPKGGRGSPRSQGAPQTQRPGGAKKVPWDPHTLPGAVLWAQRPDPAALVPPLQLCRDSEVSQRIFPPSPAPGTAKHFPGLGTHAGDAAGADGGTEQGGGAGGGPTSISSALQGSTSGWFAATIPRAMQAAPGMKSKCVISIFLQLPRGLELLVCACMHWRRWRNLSQRPLRLGQALESLCGGADVLLPLTGRQAGLLALSAPGFCREQLALPAWPGDLLGTYVQISVFETPFL